MSKSKKTKKLSALDVLREFVQDCELAAATDSAVVLILAADWPDLYETYKHAKAVLANLKPSPFDERRYEDPQGVIDDLITQTTKQGVDIHHLTQALKSAEEPTEVSALNLFT